MIPFIRFNFDESTKSIHDVFQTSIEAFYKHTSIPVNDKVHLERLLYTWISIIIDRHTTCEEPLKTNQWLEYYSSFTFPNYQIKAMVHIKGV
jgi:hypothetical protein